MGRIGQGNLFKIKMVVVSYGSWLVPPPSQLRYPNRVPLSGTFVVATFLDQVLGTASTVLRGYLQRTSQKG